MEQRHVSPQRTFFNHQNVTQNFPANFPGFNTGQNIFNDSFPGLPNPQAASNPFLMSTLQQLSLGQNTPFPFQPCGTPTTPFGGQTLPPAAAEMAFSSYMQQQPWMPQPNFGPQLRTDSLTGLKVRPESQAASCSMMQPAHTPMLSVAGQPSPVPQLNTVAHSPQIQVKSSRSALPSHGNYQQTQGFTLQHQPLPAHFSSPCIPQPEVAPSAPKESTSASLFAHPIDTLEEALKNLGQEYTNFDGDLDVDENLIRDAFFGAVVPHQPEPDLNKYVAPETSIANEGSLLHSIFEYDPSTLTQNTESATPCTPPPPPVVPPTVVENVVTPKLREKVKMKREKELAEIDRAFDRHLRSVAQKAALPPLTLPPVPQLTNEFGDHQFPCLPGPSSQEIVPEPALSPVRFSPVQFSPGSPSSDEQPGTSGIGNLKINTQDVQVFIPKDDVKKKKSNKIPIWKKTNKDVKKKESLPQIHFKPVDFDDEYSFTDEEGEIKNDPIVDSLKEQRLEQEVAKKLLEISSLHPELKPNVVPPISTPLPPSRPPQRVLHDTPEGQTSEELWRHVVPKKRHTVAVSTEQNRPSAPLLPPAATELRTDKIEDYKPTALSLAAQLAQTLKERREKRKQNCFVQTEILFDDTTTAMPLPKPIIKMEVEDPDEPVFVKSEPLLPKVIIRIPKICIKREPVEEIEKEKKKHHKKKHKKEKKLEFDENGEIIKRKKKKKKKKHRENDGERKERHRRKGSLSSGSTSEDSDPEDSRAACSTDPGKFSKKRRLMDGWTGSENKTVEPTTIPRGRLKFNYDQEDAIANDLRLSQFRQPSGMLQKGTFVVCKTDITKSDCALWKVDNQNLLQKFIPTEDNGKIVYKSSSTYSGWCPQNADQYLVLTVHYLTHSRSQCIVQPETPILDLFPAVSHEIQQDSNELLASSSLSPPECDQHLTAADQPLRDALDTYLHALILHCLSGNFLQSIRQGNERKFLHYISDIDALNLKKSARLLKEVNWNSTFRSLVQEYPLCTVADTEGDGFTCQACDKKPVDRVVQLFANERYDFETLEPRPPRTTPGGSPLPSQEYLVCTACSDVATFYHKLHHMRYHMFKKCEERVDSVRDENPTAEPGHVFEQCFKRAWINQIIQEYLDLWRKVADDGFIFQR